MAQTNAIVDTLLTNVSSMLQPEGFLCEDLLAPIGVKMSSGLLPKYSNSHLRIESSLVAGRGKYRRVETITRSTSAYKIEEHGLEAIVTQDDYDNVQLPFDAEADEVIGLTSSLWVEKEVALATALSDTAVMTQNTTLSSQSQFSDYDNSDPLKKFKEARQAVKDGCGKAPDTAWMDWSTKNVLKFHPQLLDFLGFKYTQPGGLSDAQLANALDVKQVLVAESVYNTAAEGQADVLSACWGKHLWFGVVPSSAQVRQVALGYRLFKTSMPPRKVYKFPSENPPGATKILVGDSWDFLLSNALAAYLIRNAVA